MISTVAHIIAVAICLLMAMFPAIHIRKCFKREDLDWADWVVSVPLVAVCLFAAVGIML